MFSSHSPATDSHPIFSKLEPIARLSGLVQRSSHRFSGQGFLLALLQAVTRGTTSLNQIAIALGGLVPKSMSRQALWKRFSPASTSFLLRVVSAILAEQSRKAFEPLNSAPFRRVIVEDSTVISMAKSNAEHFPNNGNRRGATAGCKINLVTDLISGRTLASQMHSAREPDQSLAGEILDLCGENDLVIRDMGYFHLETIEQIEQRKTFWLSRLPASVSVVDAEGRSLETLLRTASTDRLDLLVFLGSKHGHPCRLVATRLSRNDTAKHRRQRRRSAKKHGQTPSKNALLRDGWNLLVTNLSEERIAAAELHAIYAMRWNIEIQFRAFKQSCRLGPSLNHRSDPLHIEGLVLASMIFQLLTLDLHARFRRRAGVDWPPSLEKLSDAYATHLQTLRRSPEPVPFDPDPRHLAHDQRCRPTLWQSIVQSLG